MTTPEDFEIVWIKTKDELPKSGEIVLGVDLVRLNGAKPYWSPALFGFITIKGEPFWGPRNSPEIWCRIPMPEIPRIRKKK